MKPTIPKQQASSSSNHRLPAPALFVGPPSHNASTSSLTKHPSSSSSTSQVPASNPTSPGLSRQNTNLLLLRQNTTTTAAAAAASGVGLSRHDTDSPFRNHGGGGAGEDASKPTTVLSNTLSSVTQTRHDDSATSVEINHQHNQQDEEEEEKQQAENTLQNKHTTRSKKPRRGTAVLDAHWAALQSTLSDIELSATSTSTSNPSSSSHVFNLAHAQALEELRAAQVELARAWGQTSTFELDATTTGGVKRDKNQDIEAAESNAGIDNTLTRETQSKEGDVMEREKEDFKSGGSSSSNTDATRLYQAAYSNTTHSNTTHSNTTHSTTTSGDMTQATLLRQTSDTYFTAVKQGVAQVVQKLNVVSKAMREVELQSRDIWGDDDDGDDDEEQEENDNDNDHGSHGSHGHAGNESGNT
jgi:hypothetical protein